MASRIWDIVYAKSGPLDSELYDLIGDYMMPSNNVCPINPAQARLTNSPKIKGKTRGQGSTLEYEDSRDHKWKPAVRLQDIRARLVREEPTYLYDQYKERGHDATDVTTFLAKDKTYGASRAHRAPLLFQIHETKKIKEKPKDYMMDRGRIVLDAYDHGIRDFPTILPKCLSSEIGGYDLEHYFRQNEELQLYDILARQPNGYNKKNPSGMITWHEGPPRYGTVGMRGTRFRLQAGLLSWTMRMGSKERNDKILSIIPEQFKAPAVNSTKGFRDLYGPEQEAVSKVLLGTAPARRRKEKKISEGNNKEESDDDLDTESTDDEESNQPLIKRRRVVKSTNKRVISPVTPTRSTRPTVQASSRTKRSIRLSPTKHDHQMRQRYSANSSALRNRLRRSKNTQNSTNMDSNESDETSESSDEVSTHNDPKEGNTTQVPTATPTHYLTQSDVDIIQSNDPLDARLHNAFLANHRPTRPNPPPSVSCPPPLDKSDRDFRVVAPGAFPATLTDNIKVIQDALAPTRLDYELKLGIEVPKDLIEEVKDQSYCMQHHAMQQQFSKIYEGRPIPHLYILPSWRGAYRNWKIDEEGQALYLKERKR